MTPICVIVPVWNCAEWLPRNLEMLQGQLYKDLRVHIVDDASSDASPSIIQSFVDKNPNWSVHRNEVNQKCPRNLWEAVKRMNPAWDEVIFLLDGDDYLPSRRVMTYVAEQFQDETLWLAYGQYHVHPKNTGQIPATDYPGTVYHKRAFRASRLQLFNHPLMIRAHLWNALDESDLRDSNGEWFTIGYDKVIMLPLLELATPDDGGSRHWRVFNKVLYMYNAMNPDSDCHKDPKLQEIVDEIWDRPVKKAHYL